MSEIPAIIVDDEKNSRIVLEELLKKYCPEVSIVDCASNIDDAYKIIREKEPQLIFLDIQMPNGNGFDLLNRFQKIPFQVIFITSHSQFAINAIKFNALDYILKPVDIEDLKTSVRKATEAITHQRNRHLQIINLINDFSQKQEKKLMVHDKENVQLINISSVVYIKGEGNYSKITTTENQSFVCSKTLKDFEDYFNNHANFIRIHKSIIINTNHIKQYSKTEPCIINMVNGKDIEVSRRKRQEILDKLKK